MHVTAGQAVKFEEPLTRTNREVPHTPVDLGDNLVLRFAGRDDVEALVEFNTATFDERVTQWTRDLASGGHPTVKPEDFTIVEDTRRKAIVSSMCLISQTWAYRQIPFGVARFEVVATDPNYRRRGLIRRQFEIAHAVSAAKGQLLQVITGVDWFYRQFGYEMGPRLWGSRCIELADLNNLIATSDQQVRLRPAQADDHAFIRATYQHAMRDQLLAAVRSPQEWEYEFSGRARGNTRRREWMMIESTDGEPLGYVQYLPCLASPSWPIFRVYQIELKSGVSYLNVASSVLRGVWSRAQEMFANGELPCTELRGLELTLERDHPFFKVVPPSVARDIRPSPWYIRIADMAAFLRTIRPALEQQLVGTPADTYTGELRLNFFRSGLFLKLERGRIVTIENWKPGEITDGNARLPEAAFLQIVCGWKRFHQLADNFAECWSTHEASVLLDCLFPSFDGKVWVLA